MDKDRARVAGFAVNCMCTILQYPKLCLLCPLKMLKPLRYDVVRALVRSSIYLLQAAAGVFLF